MDDISISLVLTMITINTCGAVYILKHLLKLISKLVHYIHLLDEEEEQ